MGCISSDSPSTTGVSVHLLVLTSWTHWPWFTLQGLQKRAVLPRSFQQEPSDSLSSQPPSLASRMLSHLLLRRNPNKIKENKIVFEKSHALPHMATLLQRLHEVLKHFQSLSFSINGCVTGL